MILNGYKTAVLSTMRNTAASWLTAFAAMFLTDICWARYTVAASQHAALSAGVWAVALFILGAVAVLGYTRDRWLLIPASLGAFAGTYLGVIFT